MTEEEFFEFAKKVEADLIAHDPTWAEYPFGTEEGLLEQYSQTFDNVGTIFYYYVFTNTVTEESTRMTALLDMSRDDLVDPGDGIPDIPLPTPPEASDLVFYGPNAPETPALSPIWFDTETGDIRIWYNFEGGQTWVNTGVAGVGKIEFLNDLQDVDVLTVAPADKDHLQFSLADNKWLPFDMNAYNLLTFSAIDHAHAIYDLTDVTITTPKTGEALKYNGTNWYNTKEDIIYTVITKDGNFDIDGTEASNLFYNVTGNYIITIPTATLAQLSIGDTVSILCNTSGVTFNTTGVTVRIQPSKQLSFSENDSIIYVTYVDTSIVHISGALANV